MKLKHNKRRNTAFLFEMLVKELARASLQEDESKKKDIVLMLKTFFGKGSVLAEELDLYRTIYETKNVEKTAAEKIITEVKRVYSGLSQGEIYKKQTRLINRVNKSLTPNVFTNFVPNYRTIASISQIFNKKISIKDKVLLESQLIKHMISKKQLQKKNELQIKNSVLRAFAKQYNAAYDNMYTEQKELLSKFISSFMDNGLELKIFLNEEIGRLKEETKLLLNDKDVLSDSEMKTKIENVLKILNGFKGQHINESVLEQIIKIQELTRETQKQ